MIQTNKYEERTIRVFVSSTFMDMMEEREILVKKIFPQLRKLCIERHVFWGEVDLRWGITDEQKAEGKVLPICLKEIKKCHPYFIGLLGERYGWIPDKIDEDLIKQEKWLELHKDHSITELEILQGVLNNPDMAEHAFFYFRDKDYIEKIPEKEKNNYLEIPTEKDITTLGENQAIKTSEEKKAKLENLKNRIRLSSFPVNENYKTPKELGQFILQDLIQVIDKNFPKEEIPDPLDRIAIEHESFANSRHGIYIGKKEYFKILEKYVEDNSQPLVILGESGSGKSALLSNWAIKYKKNNPNNFMILHFIGSTAISTDWVAMMRRIMGELKRKFDIQGDIPDNPDKLHTVFANWLYMSAAKGKVIIVLDALNQLEDRDQVLDLKWLPPVLPENIRLILSTLPGKPLDEIKKRNWQTLYIELFTQDEQREYIFYYLMQYRKELAKERIDEIVQHKQSAIPLFLQALLEELRLYGDHDTLKNETEKYLKAENITELYQKILERYEKDYEEDKKDLVKNAFSLLWAARKGLSENELMELLNSVDNPLPRAYWSPLYLATEKSLVSYSGLLNFSHEYFRQAVQNKFLPNEKKQKTAHLHLARYFNKQKLQTRKIDELPWQYSKIKDWQKLYDLLSDVPFFEAGWKNNKFEIETYWASIERYTKLRKTEAYKDVINNPSAYDSLYVEDIASIMFNTGNPKESFLLRKYLTKYYESIKDETNYSVSIGNQANILVSWGKYEEAMEYYNKQLRICKKFGNKRGISIVFGNIGNIYLNYGNYEKAIELFKSELKISEEIKDKKGLSHSYANMGNVYFYQSNYTKSIECYNKAIKIFEELGDKKGISNIVLNIGNIYVDQGKYEKGMACYEKQLRISEKLGDKKLISKSFGCMGIVFSYKGNSEKALEFFMKQKIILEELGDKRDIAITIGNMGIIYKNYGKFIKAMECYKKGLKILKELGEKSEIAITIGNMGNVYFSLGNYEKAMKCFYKKLKVCEELSDKRGILTAFGNIGVVYMNQGNYDKAIEYYCKQLRLCEELGNRSGISIAVENMGVIYRFQGNYMKAIECFEKALEIANDIGDKWHLPSLYSNKSNTLYKMEQYEEAGNVNEEYFEIAKEMNDMGYILAYNVQKVKIDFKIITNYDLIIKNCILPLEKMLMDTNEEEQIAALNFELWKMKNEILMEYPNLCNTADWQSRSMEENKETALVIYQKLFGKTPNFEYKNKIEELEKLN
jgi:tetratricopeptide (TPR) repeat protein